MVLQEEGMIPLIVTKRMIGKRSKRRDPEAQREDKEVGPELQKEGKEADLEVENHCLLRNPKEEIMTNAVEAEAETGMKGRGDLDRDLGTSKKTEVRTSLEKMTEKKTQHLLLHQRRKRIY